MPEQLVLAFVVSIHVVIWSWVANRVAQDAVTEPRLTVHGNFSMSVSYTWFGNARNRSSYVTAYDASLFWDGHALQLITIDGAN